MAAPFPRMIWNDDGDDLKWTAYGHEELWVPDGEKPRLAPFASPREFLDLRIGPLAGTPVDVLSFCGNFGAPIWDFPRERIAALGDNPLKPVIDFTRVRGMRFVFSIRMNDWHHAWFNWPHLWTRRRKETRHLFLKPIDDAEWRAVFEPWLDGRVATPPPIERTTGMAYDYARLEVREMCLSTILEACARYDVDGIELDWLREPLYFREGAGGSHIGDMTAFVETIRGGLNERAARRGRPIELSMRLPASPAGARDLGLDGIGWMRRGLVDWVIAGGEAPPVETEGVREWVREGRLCGIPVYGGMCRHGGKRFDSASFLEAASELWQCGVHGIHVFNFYLPAEYGLLRRLSDLQPSEKFKLHKEKSK